MSDQEEMIDKLPDYVRDAFGAIEIYQIDENYLCDFTERWGKLSLATFVRALREGDWQDQQVSTFAIGYTKSAWARDLLLPLLHSEHPRVRWASALSLGKQRVEAAYPVLIRMLQEFFPPGFSSEDGWYEIEHIEIAEILGSWGKPEAIEPLCDTLAKMWRVEQQRSKNVDPQIWWLYQDALVYALGQLGVFNALINLDISMERRRFWTVTLIMGYLHARHLYKKPPVYLAQDAYSDADLAEFLTLVSVILQEKTGMSPEDADFAVQQYVSDYYDRWKLQDWQRWVDSR